MGSRCVRDQDTMEVELTEVEQSTEPDPTQIHYVLGRIGDIRQKLQQFSDLIELKPPDTDSGVWKPQLRECFIVAQEAIQPRYHNRLWDCIEKLHRTVYELLHTTFNQDVFKQLEAYESLFQLILTGVVLWSRDWMEWVYEDPLILEHSCWCLREAVRRLDDTTGRVYFKRSRFNPTEG